MLILAFNKSKTLLGKPIYSKIGVLVGENIYITTDKTDNQLDNWDYVVIYGIWQDDFLNYIKDVGTEDSIYMINNILQISKEKPNARIKNINDIMKFLIEKGHSILEHGSESYHLVIQGYK